MTEEVREPNSFDDFLERFMALQDEANAYGIRSLVALNDSDRLSEDETVEVVHRGGYANAVGLATLAKRELFSQLDHEE